MLFIFRKLRKSFFLPGKVRTYVAYAVGEIFLIVVGILIAVQIGDWKEAARLEKQRVELIENLKSDFRINLKRLDECIDDWQLKEEGLLNFLKVAAGDDTDLSIDEIKSLAANAFVGGISFQPALASYQAALATGSFSLIGNASLNELFILFEGQNRSFLALIELGRQDHFLGGMLELHKTLGSFEVLYENSKFKPDAYILSDHEYRNLIAQKEVYAGFSSKHEIFFRRLGKLRELKELTEQILTALEAL